jgi:hypothetical protein
MANILMLEGSSFHNSVEVPGSLNGLHCIVLYCIVLYCIVDVDRDGDGDGDGSGGARVDVRVCVVHQVFD